MTGLVVGAECRVVGISLVVAAAGPESGRHQTPRDRPAGRRGGAAGTGSLQACRDQLAGENHPSDSRLLTLAGCSTLAFLVTPYLTEEDDNCHRQ